MKILVAVMAQRETERDAKREELSGRFQINAVSPIHISIIFVKQYFPDDYSNSINGYGFILNTTFKTKKKKKSLLSIKF